ncbi:EutN/CcmL family microcompartment protein [Paraclostridium ghonii]|uniref:Ethanolamine utilization protein EutN n=1 Tax=Paraclostridium ghonii TaxID=29358 RepID=A0ABU0MXT5_9FIRM|nr:EutN/CcmL family microcompartment protein [Paeniclostridium ghonii]MCM0166216.1 EutN/CcmL family microcompartment protein [Paeniclostridium ghonii]MDQ0555641.1 ethanolamine utilization protein EutN [Paeniclostridium ghonii]
MQIGKVIGTVVSTKKDETLVGSKLMITQPLNFKNEIDGKPLIAVDTVGAGIGELVIYTEGAAARNATKKVQSSINAAIIGIVDNIDVWED